MSSRTTERVLVQCLRAISMRSRVSRVQRVMSGSLALRKRCQVLRRKFCGMVRVGESRGVWHPCKVNVARAQYGWHPLAVAIGDACEYCGGIEVGCGHDDLERLPCQAVG